MKSAVLIIVQSDFPKGASKFAKYLAVLYVAVTTLEAMSVSVNSFNMEAEQCQSCFLF